MSGYLKHLYDEVSRVILLKWETVYLAFAKAGLVLLGALLVWVVFKRLMRRLRERIEENASMVIRHQILDLVQKAVSYTLILGSGIYLLNLFRIPLLEKIFYAALIVLLAVPVKDFTLILISYFRANLVNKSKTKIDDIVFDLLNKFSGILIFATAFLLALDLLGINVMPFVAGAGVAGIAIGFAAKDTLSNLIAGILLIVDRPFEIGDRIEVWSSPKDQATWGDVIDIGLRATKIRTTDNIVIIIPNNEIMMRDIINYTALSDDIRVRIPIGVSYDADVAKAKSVILDTAKTAEWVLRNPPPRVVVRRFGESSVDLQLRVWIKDARRRMDTISYMTDKIKEAFDREGIEIPYPKRDITVVQKA
jgi:small-conductance mechanosensitive channel